MRFQPFCSTIGNLAFYFPFKGKSFCRNSTVQKMHFFGIRILWNILRRMVMKKGSWHSVFCFVLFHSPKSNVGQLFLILFGKEGDDEDNEFWYWRWAEWKSQKRDAATGSVNVLWWLWLWMIMSENYENLMEKIIKVKWKSGKE